VYVCIWQRAQPSAFKLSEVYWGACPDRPSSILQCEQCAKEGICQQHATELRVKEALEAEARAGAVGAEEVTAPPQATVPQTAGGQPVSAEDTSRRGAEGDGGWVRTRRSI
jgi:hypothetical protein